MRSPVVASLLVMATAAACASFRSSASDSSSDAGEDAGVEAAVASPFAVVQGKPDGETLAAIWGADAQTIFAVGTNGLHLDYYEGEWHRKPLDLGRDYTAVWGTSASDVYAVGTIQADGRGIVQHFDGASWRDEYVANTSLHGIWGSGPFVFAVGDQGMLYGKQQGTVAWGPRLSKGLPPNPNVPSSPNAPILWAIFGNNAQNFAIAADLDRVFHYVGNGDFVNLDPAVDRTMRFRSVWAPASAQTNVFFGSNYFGVTWLSGVTDPEVDAAMRDNDPVQLHIDQAQPGSNELFVRGIWGADATKVIFVGDLGKIFFYDAGTNDFTEVPSPTQATLSGVWGSAPDDVWIVGERELVLHGAFPQ